MHAVRVDAHGVSGNDRDLSKQCFIGPMKTLIAAAIVTTTISIANSASAIEITLWPVDPPTLFVDGTFVAGDYAKFVKATTGLPPGTAINLNSIGGDVREVIPIGEMIRARKFTTVAGPLCISDCAFVWLAGVERTAHDDSHIGFHGVWIKGTGQVSADGNATLSAYLGRLGYRDDAIRYMTKALPMVFEWLDFDTAQRLGISIQRLEGPAVWGRGKFPYPYQYSCPISAASPCELPMPKGPFPDALKNYRPVWK